MVYTQRYQSYDPNNGVRARLQVCNPNPNRVKGKGKGTGGGGCHWNPVTTATARGKMNAPLFYTGAQQEQKRSVFWIIEKKGDIKNSNPNPRRKLGEEQN